MSQIASTFTDNGSRILPDGYTGYFGPESLEGLSDNEAIEVLFDYRGYIESSPMTVFLLRNLEFNDYIFPIAFKRENDEA